VSEASRAEYEALLARAERVFELPGQRARSERAYEWVGRALVAHTDILVALWDGADARGPGGTAAVIAMALQRGMPVIHLQPGSGTPRILWSGYEPLPVQRDRIEDYPAMECSDAALGTLVARLLAPDPDPVERECLAYYYRERERQHRGRFEYPLLLAVLGVRPLSWSSFRARPYEQVTADEWTPFRATLGDLGVSDSKSTEVLQRAYSSSDNLANHFAQLFRSGHVLNFALAALAVMFALSGLVFPAVKLWLIVAELVVIGQLVLNTHIGRSHQWHRRWLDYRYLAECLRPMRSIKLFGLALAAERRATKSREPRRWPDWYAESVWRHMGCPSGRVDERYDALLTVLVKAEELKPQIAYHRANAKRMHKLEHRLHRIGNVLFVATIVECAFFIGGYFLAHEWAVASAPIVTAITASLPALGGAIYGIRVQGDFGGAANRSLKTAAELEQILQALETDPPASFAQAAALTETAARLMLSDLDEWQLTYRQRGLDIPG
jgi:hypothetical protein